VSDAAAGDAGVLDTPVAEWDRVPERTPHGAFAAGVDLVIVRFGERHSVLYGRCQHRGVLMADGRVDGDDLVCGVHGWDYRIDTGISAYNPTERLHRFASAVVDGHIMVSAAELAAFRRAAGITERDAPLDEFEVHYGHPHPAPEEPAVAEIHELAQFGLDRVGHHGPMTAMGVPRTRVPSWDDIQVVTAQLARLPLNDGETVGTDVIIGPNAARPMHLNIPVFVSDMSFGALSEEAKVALARGAERAGTGICSGEGGMLPEEQAENGRYFYELASARFGWSPELLERVQAFHLKFGQGAKTGTGGHLPGNKVVGKIAKVRGLPEGTAAISPATFPEFAGVSDIAEFLSALRDVAGGIPFGAKLSAQRIEDDIDAAIAIGVDYIILDGRGGGTGAAPKLFRDHISVPTIPALARARRHLDRRGRPDITLVATGGLRTAPDIVKALALGADAVAVSNAALQAIGCVGMRACNTDNCPVGIATQNPALRGRLRVDVAAERLARYLTATTELIQILARACGHAHIREFRLDDLATFDREMALLAGIPFAGVGDPHDAR
jgi:glutamate synthase domain-containing protein 2/nitrite reductase/ring-hydroxylating ferredoxin subunit